MRSVRVESVDRPGAVAKGGAPAGVLGALVPAWGGGVLVVLALVLALATRHGPGVTPDSIQYLSAARSFASGEGFTSTVTELHTDAAREPLAWWPPLYPALLAAGSRAGWTAVETARWVAVASTLAAVALTGLLARRLAGPAAARASVVLYAALFSTTMTGSFVWSEPVFTALAVGALLCLGRGIGASPRETEWLFWSGLLAGLAMLTRYMGTAVIAGLALGLVWVSLHLPARRVAGRLAAFLAPAVLPNAVWLARNRLLTGGAFGPPRPDAAADVEGTFVETVITLLQDSLFPLTRLGGAPAAWGLVAGVAALGLLAAALVSGARHVRLADEEESSGLGIVLWAFALVYLAGLAFFVTTVRLDPVNTRYAAPAYPVLLVLLVSGARAFVFGDRPRHAGRWARRALAGTFVLLLLPHLAADLVHASGSGRERRDLTAPYWTSVLPGGDALAADSGLQRLADLAGPRALVLSNRWELVGVATGVPTKPLPGTGEAAYPGRLFDFPGAWIAVHRPSRRYRATAEDLHALAAQRPELVFVEDAGDWSLFRIRAGVRAKTDEGDS